MKVKVRDTIYDGKDEPVMVILTDDDKFNIAHMSPEASKYCEYPDNTDPEIIRSWMKELNSSKMEDISHQVEQETSERIEQSTFVTIQWYIKRYSTTRLHLLKDFIDKTIQERNEDDIGEPAAD
jgi:hypothetical protein